MTLETVEEFNEAVKDWGKNTRQLLLMRMISMGLNERVAIRKTTKKNIRRMGIGGEQGGAILRQIAGEETLYESLRQKYKRSSGEIFFVSFPFHRKGLFVAKGVSRGHKLSNPRKKQDWYSDVMEMQTAILANIIADRYADGITKEVLKVVGTDINWS